MSENIENRLRRLEERLEIIESALRPNLKCPKCGCLLTLHEEYTNVVYEGTSHAQCYHCGFAQNIREPVDNPDNWHWRRGQRRI